jgi:hypothetical protein
VSSVVPLALLDALNAEVRHYGRLDMETGMFLLACRRSGKLTTLALAGKRGITRDRHQFAVSGAAMASVFGQAREWGLRIAVQLHSHRGAAFLSSVDLKHGFSVEGFTTCVIPYYRRPSHIPAMWGWWRYLGGQWQRIPPYATEDTGAISRVVTFDEDGVHAS